jgi:VRR-NUC domain
MTVPSGSARSRTGKPAGPAVRVTEKQMADTLRDACSWTRWRCAHFRPGLTIHGTYVTAVQGDGKGFPDWVLVHDRGGVVFVELKTVRGRLTPAQEEWGEALIRAGAVYRVIHGMDQLDAFCQELAERAARS